MRELSPVASGFLAAVISLMVLGAFIWTGEFEKGKIAAFSVFALVMAARIQWAHRKSTTFWLILVGMALAHGLLVFAVHWPAEHNPAAIFAPFAVADIFVMVVLFGYFARRFG